MNKRKKVSINQYIKTTNGITLIALIITILVMMVLIGTSVKSLIDSRTAEKSKGALNTAENEILNRQEDLEKIKDEWKK